MEIYANYLDKSFLDKKHTLFNHLILKDKDHNILYGMNIAQLCRKEN